MREQTVTLYRFDELPTPEAKQKAIEWLRTLENENFDSAMLTEEMEESLEYHYGITNVKLQWRLDHTQGDGVAFYGTPEFKLAEGDGKPDSEITLKLIADLEALGCEPSIEIAQRGSGHYDHYNTMRVDVEPNMRNTEPEDQITAVALAEQLEEHLASFVKDASKHLENFGYAEIEYRLSDEALIESIEANDLEFLADGRRPRL